MATANSSRLARRRARVGGNRPRTHPAARRKRPAVTPVSPSAGGGDASSDPAGIFQAHETAIEAERRNLQQADAVLGCIVVALHYGYENEEPCAVDFSDAVLVARRMVHASITNLDSVSLARSMAEPGESDE